MHRTGLLLLVACGASVPKDDTADTGAGDADADADSDSDSDSDADTDVGMASLSGRVTEVDGTPVPDAAVNLCRTICRTARTDIDGYYVYSEVEAWTTSFYVLPAPELGLVSPMATLTPAEEQELAIDIVLHEPTANAPLPPVAAEIELSGLLLTVGEDTLEPALFQELPDTVSVAAVEAAQTLPIEVTGTVLAIWHLAPFEAKSEAGLPLRIVNSWSLPAGESYRVWVAGDPFEHSWLDQGTLTVSADGGTLEGEVSVPILTTVVLVDE